MPIVTGFLNQQLEDIAKELLPHDDFTKVYPNIPVDPKIVQFTHAGDNAFGNFGNRSTVDSIGSWAIVVDKTLLTWKDLSFGYHHVAAIKANGTLWTWGRNIEGQIGDNTQIDRSSPVQIGAGTDWALVCASGQSTHAIKTNGTLWSWGDDDFGQLGLGNIGLQKSPMQVGTGTDWAFVHGQRYNTAAIKTNGTLWTWGDNTYGQTGNPTGHALPYYEPNQVGSNTNWKTAQVGYDFMTAFKVDGTLWAWGRNNYGQLGTNNIINRSSPVLVASVGNAWTHLNIKDSTCRAIKADGTLWAWGRNDAGQLGINVTTSRSSPVQTVLGGNDWVKVMGTSLGTYAIKNDGSLWSWGLSYIADTVITYKSSPVQYVGKNYLDIYTTNIQITTVQDVNIE